MALTELVQLEEKAVTSGKTGNHLQCFPCVNNLSHCRNSKLFGNCLTWSCGSIN